MTHPALIERITRSLAYMLRHQPEQFDLELDEYGYADLDDVVQALNERLGEAVEGEDVHAAIASGDRVRYEIVDGRIRALYGHSIEVKPGEPSRPPALLYVGVSSADAERARRYGLRAGRRRFLHLALTPDDALETGRRSARDYVVITVNALDAWEEGINFYDRKSLFLSDPIPTHFLEVGDMHSDGYGDENAAREGARRDDGRRDDRRGEFRRDDRRAHEQHGRQSERAPQPARPHGDAMREEFAASETAAHPNAESSDFAHAESERGQFAHGEPARAELAQGEPSRSNFPAAGHEGSGEFRGRRRRRRGGRPHDEPRGVESHSREPNESAHGPRHGHEPRREEQRPPHLSHGASGESRGRPARAGGDERPDFQRAPGGGRSRGFEPQRGSRDDRPDFSRRNDERPHAAPATTSRAPSPRPAERPTTPSGENFGTGIFEAAPSEKPVRERARAPREPAPEPRQETHEWKPEKPDDSGFGAGI
jgi:putative RNA 2'-phosphotransferase